jgi:hypothetical protein
MTKKTIKIATDVWTPTQIEAATEYALNNDTRVRELMGSDEGFFLIETLMRDKNLNALLRERVVSRVINLRHNFNMLSTTAGMTTYDAVDETLNQCHEIKTEQHSTYISRTTTQLTGGGAFGFEDHESIVKFRDHNPMITYAAFYDGRLLGIANFRLSDSEIVDTINRYIDRRIGGKKTTCKFLLSDWKKAASLDIKFCAETWPNDANRNLRIFFKWEEQKKLNNFLPNPDFLE